MKKFFTTIVILGFAGGTLFGIFAMNHSQNFAMSGDCPLSSSHTTVCPADALPMASHSISMYQVFTNSIVSSGVMQILLAVLLFVVIVYVLRRDIILIPYLSTISRNFDANLRRPQAVTYWLSLLINSPSLS